MNFRKAAMTLAVGGAAFTLIGVGVGASFTDTATATSNISVGTFGIKLSSDTNGAVVSNLGHTVTLTCPAVESSIPGSCPLAFTVTNTGSMPAAVTVTSSGGIPQPFADIFPLMHYTVQTIAAGGSFLYYGGFAWGALGNASLGTSLSLTYTVSAVG